jgi:1-deoxyxylulose-5-phosphate synthase
VINERAAMIEQQKRAKRRSMRHHEVRRTTVARTKSDRVDAQLLANSLRSVGLRRPMFGCRPCSTAQRCAWGSRRHHAEPSRTSSALRSIPWSFCMQVARLGRTGLKVSRICLGTMTFGVQCDEAQSRAILDHAAEGGVSFIDTADGYPLLGNPQTVGLTEEILGRWLAGKRNNFIVATKCFAAMGPNPWDRGTSRRHILEAVDNSLRRLKTDWIDLYQLHNYDPDVPMDEALEAMDSLIRSGKVRYIGCSNWPAFRLARSIGRSETNHWARFDSVQPRYSLLFRQWERDLFPLCEEEGIGVICFSPLAGGLLSGKYDPGSPPAADTRFGLHEFSNNMYWHPAEFETVEKLKGIASELGMSLPTLAIAWTLSRPAITAPIIGASKPAQLDDSLAAVDVTLSADVLASLDEISRVHRRGDAPL